MDFSQKLNRMQAALFDMDGTILDSMPAWRGCNLEYLERHGITLTEEQKQYVVCASSATGLFDYVRETLGHEIDIQEFRALQQERMQEAYAAGIAVKPGARECLAALHARGVKIALATATWSSLTVLALARSGLMRDFDFLCCGDVVHCSKSKPEYFDRASELIGVPKDRCILFDDAIYAVKGASGAGLLGIVAVADPTNEIYRDDLKALSDVFVESLAEILP